MVPLSEVEGEANAAPGEILVLAVVAAIAVLGRMTQRRSYVWHQ